jgi:hypothetical protein
MIPGLLHGVGGGVSLIDEDHRGVEGMRVM